jgi:hypothetical protein
VGEFTEVESGKRADRPQLAAALAACKKQKAKLVIAKLDRLSRNLAFIAALRHKHLSSTSGSALCARSQYTQHPRTGSVNHYLLGRYGTRPLGTLGGSQRAHRSP